MSEAIASPWKGLERWRIMSMLALQAQGQQFNPQNPTLKGKIK